MGGLSWPGVLQQREGGGGIKNENIGALENENVWGVDSLRETLKSRRIGFENEKTKQNFIFQSNNTNYILEIQEKHIG